jgi:hypothetical protein
MKLAYTLAAIVSMFVFSARSSAQPVTHPDQVGTLSIEVHGELAPDQVRSVVSGELGIDVTDGTAFAPTLGRVEVVADRGIARVAYHPAAGTVIERTFSLPEDPAEALQMIAFVVTNLVRDQARDVIEDLPPIVIPPHGEPPPREPPIARRTMPFTIGLVPPLALDRVAGEHVCVGVGIHALVGATDCSKFTSISGLADIQRESASGAQIAGLVAAAGRVDGGAQIAGIAAYSARASEGAQIAGIASIARDRMRGVQIGGVTAGSRRIDGVQIAGVASFSSTHAHGLQIGGVATYAKSVDGLQIAGVANVGGDVEGAQIGVVNVARKMRGLQLGVINVSEDGDDAVPIGLINIVRNGRLAAESWVETSRLTAAAVRHGSRRVHNVWGVAWSQDHDHVLVGGGLGTTIDLGGPYVDLDAMHWFTNVWDGETGQLAQLRASLAWPMGNLEIFGGAAANVYISDEMDESADFHPVFERRTTTSGGRAVVGWPTAFVGVRLRAR